jgi:hypothetical protein
LVDGIDTCARVLTGVLCAFVDVDLAVRAGVARWACTREAGDPVFATTAVFARVGCAVIVVELAVGTFEAARAVAAVGGEPILAHAVVQAWFGAAVVVIDLTDWAFIARVTNADELRVERGAATVLTWLLRARVDRVLTTCALVASVAAAAEARALCATAATVIARVLSTRVDSDFAQFAFVACVAATTEEIPAWATLAMSTGLVCARPYEFFTALTGETWRARARKQVGVIGLWCAPAEILTGTGPARRRLEELRF